MARFITSRPLHAGNAGLKRVTGWGGAGLRQTGNLSARQLLLLVGHKQRRRLETEETFGDVWRWRRRLETFGDDWRRLETFGDGDSLEVQIKIKERFDVMVVTVGNWSEHKNTRLEAELPSGKDFRTQAGPQSVCVHVHVNL